MGRGKAVSIVLAGCRKVLIPYRKLTRSYKLSRPQMRDQILAEARKLAGLRCAVL